MALGIMLASLLSLYLLLECSLQVFGHDGVFRGAPQAHRVFLRPKRANQFLLEEILQGNLERECYEELCSYEEAREYFEDTPKTVAFWTIYYDGDQCEPNPCLHGGNCTDRVGGFSCSCRAPHYGAACELKRPGQPSSAPQTTRAGLTTPTAMVAPPLWNGGLYKSRHDISECPTEGPTACHQLCTAAYGSFKCTCMSGFRLHGDGRSCQPEAEFPCGTLPEATTSNHRHGNCPWQVSLLNSRGAELCGGVVLGQRSILTAAHCLFLDSEPDPQPSNFFVLTGNTKTLFKVQALYLHSRFRKGHHDDDVVLLELAEPLTFGPALIHLCLPTKDFSENILMQSGRAGVTNRRGRGQSQNLVYMMLDDCRQQLNVSYPLSNKMFCMRRQTEHVASHNRTSRGQRGPPGTHRRSLQHGVQRNPKEPSGNQTGHQRTLPVQSVNETASNGSNPGSGARSETSSRSCDGLLPGSPVATVERGTAYLTGLMISSADCDGGGGLVFIKLSRYLSWIRPRLEAAENHMTPQFTQFPESR
ncbi:vitamin K-dependent protein Z-like isoform X1 [Parambassis ranga]|uniref:Vitamin K-dependent protein Z-like isoform X1 n=1 Tax=Parambassis ranga TaxID=210632 RepID=A0A6P7HTZ7_9TELE|nr:vitamin K-dependent protein Z-like isoform X1 [Parambassis ranga]